MVGIALRSRRHLHLKAELDECARDAEARENSAVLKTARSVFPFLWKVKIFLQTTK